MHSVVYSSLAGYILTAFLSGSKTIG